LATLPLVETTNALLPFDFNLSKTMAKSLSPENKIAVLNLST